MKDFIKVTRTEDSNGDVIWVSKYQIKYMEDDERHSQTFIYMTNEEIVVKETITEILTQLNDEN